MSIVWIILIGFVAGIIARLLSPGSNNPSGFILTTILGVVGAFLATFIGQAIGWYRADQGAGFIGATVGAVIVLFIWNRLVAARVISDPAGNPDELRPLLQIQRDKARIAGAVGDEQHGDLFALGLERFEPLLHIGRA
jgi:uncharacterized membrane protein YeaQ/YmgE (transglycosylase-associated protein family)